MEEAAAVAVVQEAGDDDGMASMGVGEAAHDLPDHEQQQAALKPTR